jgi:hypothetical protein
VGHTWRSPREGYREGNIYIYIYIHIYMYRSIYLYDYFGTSKPPTPKGLVGFQ